MLLSLYSMHTHTHTHSYNISLIKIIESSGFINYLWLVKGFSQMQPISPIKIVSVLNAISFQFGGYDEKTSVAQGKLLHNTTLTERERE